MLEKDTKESDQTPDHETTKLIRPFPGRNRHWYRKWWGISLLFFLFIVSCFLVVFINQVFFYYNKVKKGEAVDQIWLTNGGLKRTENQLGISHELIRKLLESSDDPYFGPKDAKVVIVEFSDFQCPFCKMAAPEVKKVIQYYKNSVRFIYRDFPLESLHANAVLAAQAAECADDQDSFWQMHDILFEHQEELNYDKIIEIGQNLDLDEKIFAVCLNTNKYVHEVEEDIKDAKLVDVVGTPTFFINGERHVGVLRFEDFKRIIDLELSR